MGRDQQTLAARDSFDTYHTVDGRESMDTLNAAVRARLAAMTNEERQRHYAECTAAMKQAWRMG